MSGAGKPDQATDDNAPFVKRLEDGRLLWWSDRHRNFLVWNGTAWVLDGRLTFADVDEAEFLTDEEVAALVRDGILPA